MVFLKDIFSKKVIFQKKKKKKKSADDDKHARTHARTHARDKTNMLMTNDSLMKVESIA